MHTAGACGSAKLNALGEIFDEVHAEGAVNSVEALSEGRPADLDRAGVRGQQDRELFAGRRDVRDKTLAHMDRPVAQAPLPLASKGTQGDNRIRRRDPWIKPQLPPPLLVHGRQILPLLPEVLQKRSVNLLHVGHQRGLLRVAPVGVLGEGMDPLRERGDFVEWDPDQRILRTVVCLRMAAHEGQARAVETLQRQRVVTRCFDPHCETVRLERVGGLVDELGRFAFGFLKAVHQRSSVPVTVFALG
ncbi:hypothetical protein R2F25_09915 [Streptomyces sp. UP1A-1]|nr:hypothetical protein [Streptomyces sp. UP1A-1]